MRIQTVIPLAFLECVKFQKQAESVPALGGVEQKSGIALCPHDHMIQFLAVNGDGAVDALFGKGVFFQSFPVSGGNLSINDMD